MRTSKTGRYTLVAVLLTVGVPAGAQNLNLPNLPGPNPTQTPQQNLNQAKQDLNNAANAAKNIPTPPGVPDPRKSAQENADQLKKDLDGAGKAAGDAAKQAAQLPVEAAKEGIKLSEEAAGALIKQVTDIVSKGIDELKAKVDKFIADEKAQLLADAMPYLYLAAAAFLAILLVPAILSSILAVWIVRRMDRRAARKALSARPAR